MSHRFTFFFYSRNYRNISSSFTSTVLIFFLKWLFPRVKFCLPCVQAKLCIWLVCKEGRVNKIWLHQQTPFHLQIQKKQVHESSRYDIKAEASIILNLVAALMKWLNARIHRLFPQKNNKLIPFSSFLCSKFQVLWSSKETRLGNKELTLLQANKTFQNYLRRN